ncbi:MAG: hypothetical protein Q4B28_03685 [bacterium]|nr:hypothetical protein [bacterium]
MNAERLKWYEGWEALEKFEMLFQQNTDPLHYDNQRLQEENQHLKEENQRLQEQVATTSQTNKTIP